MKKAAVMVTAVAIGMLTACSEKQADQPRAGGGSLEKIVVKEQPAQNPIAVLAAKKEANSGDPVVVEGKVKDFVEGAAVFTIADLSLKSCKDNGENCPTPWDYCCYQPAEISAASATVKVVDQSGAPIESNIKGVNSLDNLTPVAVEGKAEKDEQGNLVIAASKVYIR